jgi:hypothetical protein
MNKKQIVAMCREVFKEFPETFHNDKCAQAQYFNDFTDLLCKDLFRTY